MQAAHGQTLRDSGSSVLLSVVMRDQFCFTDLIAVNGVLCGYWSINLQITHGLLMHQLKHGDMLQESALIQVRMSVHG